jgi:restriction system protein
VSSLISWCPEWIRTSDIRFGTDASPWVGQASDGQLWHRSAMRAREVLGACSVPTRSGGHVARSSARLGPMESLDTDGQVPRRNKIVERALNAWLDRLPADGPSPHVGTAWRGRLDEWLEEVLKGGASDRGIQDWSFPTPELRDQYVDSIHRRADEEVSALLRLFVFDSASFSMQDTVSIAVLLDRIRNGDQSNQLTEHERRLLRWAHAKSLPHPGVRWALDLLPTFPRRAVSAIEAYLVAETPHLPDGRIDGLYDALAVIRARYIGLPHSVEDRRCTFYDLTPLQFEVLVKQLYGAMGYDAVTTRPSGDGGRDVIASRIEPGMRETLRIECKLYTGNVGVRRARELLGVVKSENANRGVLVAAGGYTRPARAFAATDPHLELVNGTELVLLLNEYLGGDWPTRLDWWLSPRNRGAAP